MLNLDHQNPSAVRRDENSTSIANHIKKEEQLRQKLDHERASKRELVERLHAEKEEIRHKSKLVVDMFKQKIAETESQLVSSRSQLNTVSNRTALTGELLRDHIAKWKLWNESLQSCDNMEVFAEYLLNQPMKFISASDSTAAVSVSTASEIPSLMITELDQILNYIMNMDLEVQLDNIPYFTLVPMMDAGSAKITKKEGSGSTISSKSGSKGGDATKSSASPVRRPLTSLDTNTGTFSASSSPLQSPASARVPRPLSSRGSLGSSKKRLSGIGMPGSQSVSFFEDEQQNEPVCLSCAANVISAAESSEQLRELSTRLKVSEEQVATLTLECATLNTVLSTTHDSLTNAEENAVTLKEERADLLSQLTAAHDACSQTEQRVMALEEEHTTLNNMLSTERAARTQTEQQVELLDLAVQKLDAKVLRLKGALEKSKTETSEVREALQRERDTHSNLQLRHTIELEAAAQAAALRMGEFSAQLEHFKALAAGPTATIAALQLDVQNRETELKEITSQLRRQEEDMRASDAQLQTLLEESRRNEEAEKIASQRAQESLCVQLRSMEEMYGQLDSFAQRRNDEAIDLAVRLEETRQQHVVDRADLSAQLLRAVTECVASQQEGLIRDDEVRNLSEQLQERSKDILSLKSKLEELEIARAEVLQELDSSATSLQVSTNMVSALELQVNELQDKLDKSVLHAQQLLSENVEQYNLKSREERQEAERLLQEVHQTHTTKMQDLQHQLAEELRRVEEMTTQLQARDAEVQLLSATLMSQSEVKSLLAAARCEADAQAAELEEMRRRFAEQSEDVALKRSAMVARIALLTEDLQSKDAVIMSLTATVEEARTEQTGEIDSLLEHLRCSEETVTELTRQVSTLSEEAVTLNQEIASAREVWDQLQEEHSQLQDQLAALEASAQVERSALTEHVADLEQRYGDLCDAKGQMEDELSTAQSRVADAVARCQGLEEQVLEHSILAASFEAQRLVWQSSVAERDQLQAASADATSELNSQLQQSMLHAQALESTLSDCESELELFKECNERVSIERDEAQELLEAASAALETAQSDLALLHTRARDSEEECASLMHQLEDHHSQQVDIVAAYEEKLSKLQQRMMDSEDESVRRSTDAEVLRTKLRENESAIAEAQSALAKRNMELDLLHQSQRETERLKDAAELKFTELEESYFRVVGKLEVRIADLVIERDSLRESASELRAESESTSSVHNATIMELEQAAAHDRDTIETLTQELSGQRVAALTIYGDLNAQSNALVDLEAQLAEQSVAFEAEKQAMLEALHTEKTVFCNQLTEMQQKADHAVSSLRSNLLSSLALGQNEVKELVAKLATRDEQFENLSVLHDDLVLCAEKDRLERVALLEDKTKLTLTLSQLTAQIENAESTIQQLNESIGEREQDIMALQSAVNALESTIDTARQQAVEREESIYGLQLCVQATEQDRMALQKSFNAATSAHASAISEAAEKLRLVSQERDELQTEQNTLQTKLADLKSHSESLQVDLLASQAAVSELHSSTEAAARYHSSELADLASRLESQTVASEELQSRLRDFEASGANASEQLRLTLEQRDTLRAELTIVKENMSEREKSLSSLLSEHKVFVETAKTTDESLQQTQLALSDSQAQLKEVSEQAEAYRLECAAISEELLSLKITEESLEKEVAARNASMEDTHKRLATSEQQVCALMEEASTAAVTSAMEIAELQRQVAEHVAITDQLVTELRDLQLTHSNHISAADETVADLSAQIQDLEHRLTETTKEMETLQHERNDLRASRGSLTVQAMNMQETIRTLQSTSATQQAAFEQNEQVLQEKIVVLAHTEARLQEARDECVALDSRLATKEKEIQALITEVVGSKTNLTSAETAIAELTDRLAVCEHDLSALSVHSADEIATLEAELTDSRTSNTTNESIIQTLSAHLRDLEHSRTTLESARLTAKESLQCLMSEHSDRVEKLESRLREFEAIGASSSEQLRLTLEQRDALQSECNAAHAIFRAAQQQMADLEAALETATSTHAQVVSELTARLVETEQLHASAIENHQLTAQEHQHVKRDLERAISDAEDQLSSVRADLEHQDDIHREAMEATETERAQWKLLSAQRDLTLLECESRLHRSSLECTALATEVVACEEAQRALSEEIEGLQLRLKNSESAVRDLDACSVERGQELDSLAASAAASIELLEASLRELERQLDLEQTQAKSDAEGHHAAMSEAQHRLSEFEALGASSSEQLRLTAQQRDSTQEKLSELQTLRAALEAELENMKEGSAKQLRESVAEQEALQTDLASTQSLLATVESQVSELQSEIATHSVQHDSYVSELQRSIEKLEKSLQETSCALALSERRFAALDVECTGLANEREAAHENENALLVKINELDRRASAAESALLELDECIVERNIESDLLQTISAASIAAINAEKLTLQDELAALKIENHQHEQTQVELIAVHSTEIQKLGAQNESVVAAIESRLRDIEAAGASSSEQLRFTLQQRDALQSECTTLALSVAEITKEIDTMRQQARDTVATHLEDMTVAQNRLQQAHADHEELQSVLQQKEETLKDFTAQLAVAQTDTLRVAAECAALTSQLATAVHEKESLREEIDSLRAAIFAAEQVTQQDQVVIAQLESVVQGSAVSIATLEADMALKMEDSATAKEEYVANIAEFEQKLSSLEKELTVRAANCSDLEARLFQATADLESAQKKNAVERNRLSASLDERTTELDAMRLHYGVLSRQLIEHIDRVDECESALAALQHEAYVAEAAELSVRARLYAAESAIKALDQDCVEKNRDLDALLASSSATIAEISAQAQDAAATISRLELSAVQREETVQELLSAQATLQSSLETAVASHEASMADQSDGVRVLENRLREFEAVGASTSEQLRVTLEQRDALQSECSGLQQSIIELEGELASLQLQLSKTMQNHLDVVASFEIDIAQKNLLCQEQESAAVALKSEIKTLQESLAAAERTISDLESSAALSLATSTEQLRQAQNQRDALQSDWDSAQQNLASLETQLTTATTDIQKQARDHSATVASLRSELDHRSSYLQQVSQALAGAEDRMEQTSAEMKTYESLLTSAQTQLASCAAEIHRLKEALADIESAKHYLEESVALGRAENAQLEDQRCAAELRCSSLESNLLDVENNLRISLKESASLAAQLTEQSARLESMVVAAQSSEEALLSKNAQLLSELSSAQEEARGATVMVVDRESRLEALRVQLNESFVQSEAHSVRIAELETTNESLSERITSTQAAFESMQEALQQAQVASSEEREKLEAQVVTLNASIVSSEGTLAQLREQLGQAAADSATQKETLDRFKEQFEDSQVALASAEEMFSSRIAALSSDLAAALEDSSRINAECLEKDALHQAVESQLNEMHAQSEARGARIAEMEASIAAVTARLATTDAELEVAQKNLEEAKRTFATEQAELQAQVIALNDSLQSLQDASAQLQDQLTAVSAESMAKKETIDQLTEQLTSSREAHSAAEEKMAAEISHLSRDLVAAQEELQHASAESCERETQRLALESQLGELSLEMESRAAHIAELQTSIESLTERIVSTEADLETNNRALASTETTLGAERDEFKESVKSLRETITHLEGQLASVAADSVAHIETIDQLTEQLTRSREAHCSAEEKASKLEALNATLTTTVSDRDALMSDLQLQLSTLSATNDAKSAELTTAAAQTKREQKKIQQLNKKLQQSEEQARTQEKLVAEGSAALAELKDELYRAERQIDVLMADATTAASHGRMLESELAQEKALHIASIESVKHANAQIIQLQGALSELQGKLCTASDDSVIHENSIAQLSEQLAACRDALATAEEIASKLSVLNKDLSCTADERAVQVVELEAQLLALQDSTSEMRAVSEASVSQLVAQLAEMTAQCDQERVSVHELSENLRQQEEHVRDQEHQLIETSAALTVTRNDLARAAAEIESLKTDAIAIAVHGHNIERLLAESEAAHASSVAAESRLQDELVTLQKCADDSSKQLSATKAQVVELNQQIIDKNAFIASVEQQVQILQEELNASREMSAKLSAESAQISAQMAALTTDATHQSALVSTLEQQLLDSAEERAVSENRLREASAEVIADLQSQLTALATQLAVAANSTEEQQKASAARDAELDTIQRDLLHVREGLASALTTAEEEQSAHELESLNLNGKIAENEFTIRELNEEVQTLTAKLQDAMVNLQELSSQVETLTDEKAILEEHLVRAQSEQERVRNSLTDLESASNNTSAKLQLDQASLHALATELVEVKAAFQHCQGQLKEQKSAASTLKAELARKKENFLLLEHRLAERASSESALQTELSTYQQHESTLKTELKRSQIDVSALSARLHESVSEMSHLRDAHANEIVQLRQAIQQREVVLQELNDRLLEQMELSDELKRQMQEATAASNKTNRDLKEKNSQLEELHIEHGVLGAQEHIHSKEISDLKAQLHTAEVALGSLKQELHVRTLESADLAVSMKQRQGGIQQLTVTLTDKDKQIQHLHSEMTAIRNKLHASEEKSTKLDIQVKSVNNVLQDLRQSLAAQEKLLEHERGVWAVDSAELIARIQESEFIIQELNDRIVENERVIAGFASRAQETLSERQRLESQFSDIRNQLQANLAQAAEYKESITPVCIPITNTIPTDASSESLFSVDAVLHQKDEELRTQAASWNLRFEELEAHTAQRVESIREALLTQFEAQAAAQHIESHMLEDKIATLEGLLAAAQHELQQYHDSHPEPAESDAIVAVQDSEEMRALQASVTRMHAKVASKSKQILLLNQQMLRDRQNFVKLKRSLVKLDELKAAVFANNFNPAVPAPPLPPNQVSELYHLGMEEATKKIELQQQATLVQQQVEFQVIRDKLESTLAGLEAQTVVPTADGVTVLAETISALHAELRDRAAAHQETQRHVEEMRARGSSKEAAHYLALSEKTVECNALRVVLHDLERKLGGSGDRGNETNQDQSTNVEEQLYTTRVELQVMTQRHAEDSQKFQRAVRTIKVLEARGDSLKEECAAANAELLKLYQKTGSKKRQVMFTNSEL